MTTTRERLIVAMDLSTLESVKCTLDNIGDAVSYYKIGMESFYSLGEAALSLMAANRKKVFLDLKLHDIPNTVSRSVKALCRYAPAMTTLHAAGGPAMLRAAVEAAAEASAQLDQERPKLLGITVLTSIDETEWAAVGHTRSIRDSVLRLAEMCRQSGMDGVVASPQEAAAIRQCCGPDFLIVTPGIRPLYGDKGDQSRTATPAEALRNGADFLVVGRPILAAADPRIAAIEIVKEMEG
jgi:orotidine-5'-phosphate decarboxylase